MPLDFMSSPRGKILNFLSKMANGTSEARSLDEFKEKMLARGISTGAEFDAALLQLETEGCVKDKKLDDAGLSALATEYGQYLQEKKAELKEKYIDWDEEIAEFDVKHAATVEAVAREKAKIK